MSTPLYHCLAPGSGLKIENSLLKHLGPLGSLNMMAPLLDTTKSITKTLHLQPFMERVTVGLLKDGMLALK
jgi:hypothetical protein